MRARVSLLIAGVVLAACQPAVQVADEPVRADYSSAPEWVKRNPLEQKPQPQAPPAVVTPPAPIVIAKAEDLPPAPKAQVKVDGWGPIWIGMTLAEVNAALGTHLTIDDDPQYAEYQCAYLNLPDNGWPGVMYSDGQVVRFDARDKGPATYGGIRIGDSAEQVRALFGAKLKEQAHFYNGLPSQYLTVWMQGGPTPDGPLSAAQEAAMRTARGIRFETDDDGKISAFYAGDGSIGWIEGCL